MLSVEQARRLAAGQLARALPRRWRHVQAVGAKAERIGPPLVGKDAPVLTAAAWLHDVGYAPALAETGFHALDGGRWLRRIGVHERVVCLVAHHSCAWLEAEERGLAAVLRAEFPREGSVTADALWYCDTTTGPDGQTLTVAERVSEITSRYGPGDVVSRFIVRADPLITAAVRRTEQRLQAVGVT